MQMAKTLPNHGSSSSGGTPNPLGQKASPLLTPQADRRISLVSLGPSSPLISVPASPSSRISVPGVRDLRSSLYNNRICSMDPNLTRAVRAAVQGAAIVTPEGRVEVGPATPVPSTPCSPAVPVPDRRRSVSSSSQHSASAASNSTPTTPRQIFTLPPDQHAVRQQCFQQLLSNLVSHLPPLPACITTTVPSGTAMPLAPPSVDPPPAAKRFFVGLSVGPSAGRIFWEDKMAWPVAPDVAPLGTPGRTTPTPPHAHSAHPLSGHPSFKPLSPTHVKTASGGGSTASAAAESSSSSSASSTTASPAPIVRTLSRRPSFSLGEDGWNDGDIVLSVFLLLDTIDVDCKQITFVAAHTHGRCVDTAMLFQMLYKVDLSSPNPRPHTQPLPVFSHAQMPLATPVVSAASAAGSNGTPGSAGRSLAGSQVSGPNGVTRALSGISFHPPTTNSAAAAAAAAASASGASRPTQ